MNLLHFDDDNFFLTRFQMLLANENTLLSDNPVFLLNTDKEDIFFDLLTKKKIDGILLDISLDSNKTSGLEILRKFKQKNFNQPVMIISSFSHGREAIYSSDLGVWDHIFKESKDEEITYHLKSFLHHLIQLNQPSSLHTMDNISRQLDKIIDSGIDRVLLTGDSGTGKELVAMMLKEKIADKQPFVAINCAAIPEALIESELFGYEKGAFTGAFKKKKGLFAHAAKGWIFLDEVARLSSSAQSALLRCLESKELTPVGSHQIQRIPTKILAATNEDLDGMVAKGLFRDDLLQRLKSAELHLPPFRHRSLKEREHILSVLLLRLNNQLKRQCYFSKEASLFLLEHEWKRSNMRELWNTLQAMAVQEDSDFLTLRHLPPSIKNHRNLCSLLDDAKSQKDGFFVFDLSKNWQSNQQSFFMAYYEAMKKSCGSKMSVKELAKKIGLSRWALRDHINKSSKEYI